VIQTCKQCGAINQSSAENCCFCNARLSVVAEPAAVSVSNRSSDENSSQKSGIGVSPATQPAWRREVKNRLRTYRERHPVPGDEDSQAALQFGQDANEAATEEIDDQPEYQSSKESGRASVSQDEFDQRLNPHFDEAANTAAAHDDEQYEDPLQATLAAAARLSADEAPASAAEKEEPFQQLLIDVSRPPEGERESPHVESVISYGSADPRLDATMLPVGELRTRRHAWVWDALFLLLSYAGILGLFAAFGGRLAPVKLDAAIACAMALLLYAQYFILFTMLGGATPGMMLTGLRVVGFDGTAPSPRQLMLRGLGYLISGGMAMLGFLWAFWDEDHLTWHDRISQTYIVSAEALANASSAAEAQDEQPLARL
jgi:uncharacterized RDD family membrane protein YckC